MTHALLGSGACPSGQRSGSPLALQLPRLSWPGSSEPLCARLRLRLVDLSAHLLSIYLPTYLPTYLPIYLSIYPRTCIMYRNFAGDHMITIHQPIVLTALLGWRKDCSSLRQPAYLDSTQRSSPVRSSPVRSSICIYLYIYICMCIYIYIYIYIIHTHALCVCVCDTHARTHTRIARIARRVSFVGPAARRPRRPPRPRREPNILLLLLLIAININSY